MLTITKYQITVSDLINDNAKQWALDHIEYLNKPMTFFGSSTKLEKGAAKFDSYVIYLQPADKIAVKTLCSFADKAGCKAPCLIDSGQLGMTTGQNAATCSSSPFLTEWRRCSSATTTTDRRRRTSGLTI